MKNDVGVVYILKNHSMPNIYKIGVTRGDVSGRVKSLSNTSVPTDFILVKQYEAEHALQLEKFVHKELRGARVSPKREFFGLFGDDAVISAVDSAVDRFVPRFYTKKEVDKLKYLTDSKLNTPSEQCKAQGLKSLRQVAEMTGVKERTLINWHKDRPLLFKVVLTGLAAELGLLG